MSSDVSGQEFQRKFCTEKLLSYSNYHYPTILFIATSDPWNEGESIAMQVLIDNGADVNIVDNNGYTALSWVGKN